MVKPDLNNRLSDKKVSIQEAALADIKEVAALKAKLELENYGSLGTSEEQSLYMNKFCSPSYIEYLLSIGKIFVTLEANRITAMITLREEEFVCLSSFYSENRGIGVGAALLGYALAEFDPQKSVEIEVFESHKESIGYFTRRSFVGQGSRPSSTFAGEHLLIMRSRVGDILDSLKIRFPTP